MNEILDYPSKLVAMSNKKIQKALVKEMDATRQTEYAYQCVNRTENNTSFSTYFFESMHILFAFAFCTQSVSINF